MDSTNKTWATVSHLGGIAVLSSVLTKVPVVNIIIPLVVWLLKRDESAYVDDHAKEALNFQISITLYSFIAIVTLFIGVGIFLVPLVGIFNFIQTIIAAIKASQGKYYRYFLSIRFIR